MARLTLWYSVQNGGDGSAYPHWFENKRLTEMDQELMSEGWGECCNGSITIEGEDMNVIGTHITTKDEFIQRVIDEILNSGYYSRRKKELARKFKEELRPESIIRNFTENDPYGEEIDEKIKKYKDFK